MAKYLYNSLRLPVLPEWDREKYPYALIGNDWLLGMLFLSTVPLSYTDFALETEYPRYRLHATDDGSMIVYSYSVLNSAVGWSRADDLSKSFSANEVAHEPIARGDKIYWANYDVPSYNDGSIYLAASYPTDAETGEEIHDYGLIHLFFAWQKQDAYKNDKLWSGKRFCKVIGGAWRMLNAHLPYKVKPPEPDEPDEPTPEPKLYYLYNDVKLPPIPEWDKEKYPYVALAKASNSSYFMVATDRKFVYGTYTPNTGASNGVTQTDVYTKYESGDKAEYQTATYSVFWSNVSNNSQTDLIPESGSLHIDFGDATPFWANHDIINVDNNTVYLPASEPVPVYE